MNWNRTAALRARLLVVTLVAVATGPTLLWAPAATAATEAPLPAVATGADFEATAAPLSYGGNDYDDFLKGGGPGSIYLPANGGRETEVTFDGTPVPGVPGKSGLDDFDVALARLDGAYTTWYVDASVFDYYWGGGYERSCSGFEALMSSYFGGSVTVACDNFSKEILKANSAYEDFTFNGYGGFENAGSVAAVSGFSDPALSYTGTPPPYYASASPLSHGGTDYDGVYVDSDDDGPSKKGADMALRAAESVGMAGVLWAIDFESNPQFVTEDNTRIGGLADSDDQLDVDVVLVTINGAHVTAYISSIWRQPSPKAGPYEASCAGFVAFLTERRSDPSEDTYVCGNFKAGIFAATGAGKDFAFTGFDGFNLDGAVSVVDGFSSPPWLTHGSYTPRATTTTTAAPAVTTTTAAPQTSTTTAAPAATTTAAPVVSTTAAPAAAILPVTGSGGRGGVTIIAIALLAAGLALQRGTRTRREATPAPTRVE